MNQMIDLDNKMNILKKVFFAFSVACSISPLYSMDGDNVNQGFLGQVWHTAKEHPVVVGGVVVGTIALGAGVWAYHVLVRKNIDIVARSHDEMLKHCEKGIGEEKVTTLEMMEKRLRVTRALEKIVLQKDAAGCTIVHIFEALQEDREEDIFVALRKHNSSIALVVPDENNAETINALVNIGYKPKNDGNMSLHKAAVRGFVDEHNLQKNASVIKRLLDSGSLKVQCAHFTTFDKDCLIMYPSQNQKFLELAVPLSKRDEVVTQLLYNAIHLYDNSMVRLLLHQNYECAPFCTTSKARICAALCAFNRLQLRLPADVRRKIFSFIPEDILSAEHLRLVLNQGARLQDFVATCPLKWFVFMYRQTDDAHKQAFLERIVPVIVAYRLQNIERYIQQWLADENTLKLLPLHRVNPGIVAMLDPDNIAQYREAIEDHVRSAFLGAQF